MYWAGIYRIRWHIALQFLVIIVISSIAYSMVDRHAALSAWAGGICVLIPNIIFAAKHFQFWGAQHAKKIVYACYLAECYKIVSTAGLIIFFLMLWHVQFGSFLMAYVVLIITAWAAPLTLQKN